MRLSIVAEDSSIKLHHLSNKHLKPLHTGHLIFPRRKNIFLVVQVHNKDFPIIYLESAFYTYIEHSYSFHTRIAKYKVLVKFSTISFQQIPQFAE